jgi:hypothetical protein
LKLSGKTLVEEGILQLLRRGGEEEEPGGLLSVVEFDGAAGFIAEDVVEKEFGLLSFLRRQEL